MTHPTDDHPRTPVRAPSRWPRILIASGIALLGLAVAAGLFSALKFVDLLPFEVLTADGEPGTSVAGVVDAPGSGEMVLEPGRYAVWLVRPAGAGHAGLDGELVVRGPDGEAVDVASGPSVSGSIERGGRDAL